MIQLDNISFSYGEEEMRDASLQEVSLSVKQGEFILVAGKSGCGKTTLTRVLNGLCPQFYKGMLKGRYVFEGRDAASIPINELGTLIGSVFQDPRSQFFASNTTDEVVLGMENNATPRLEMQKRVEEIGALLGLEQLWDRSIYPLSSGEKQRIAIASVCAMNPKVLVLDEPSSNLDSDTIKQLSILLFRLKEQGTTIILSEHRLHYVKDIFDRLVVMDEGCVVCNMTHDEARALSDGELTKLGLRLFEDPALEVGKSIPADRDAYVECHKLTLGFLGRTVLDDVDFSAQKGEILAIAGKNGVGKSSVCRVITGLYKHSVGEIMFDRIPRKRKQRVKDSFFVQQDTDYQLYAATVEEEFYVGRKRSMISREEIETHLCSVGLAEKIDTNPLALSGGQKQRLLLALAASWDKNLLVFDEPTSGLDGENMRLTAHLLRKIADSGRCVLLITHDTELITRVADSVLYLENAKAAYHRGLKKR